MIKVDNKYDSIRIVGVINTFEVISITFHSDRPATVSMSTCLPSDIEKAEEMIDCYNETFKKYHEILNQGE